MYLRPDGERAASGRVPHYEIAPQKSLPLGRQFTGKNLPRLLWGRSYNGEIFYGPAIF